MEYGSTEDIDQKTLYLVNLISKSHHMPRIQKLIF